MVVDLERIKAKLAKLKDPKGNSNFGPRMTWKPKPEGEESQIRFIQYPYGEDPFVEMWFHYGVGRGRSIVCPQRMSGRVCPICEFTSELWQSTEEADKNTAKKIGAKQRFYAAVVDRGEAEASPKFYGFGKTVYTYLLELLLNPDYEEYLDPVDGLDFIVSSEKKQGKMYPETTLTPKRKSTPLASGNKGIQEIIGNIKPIDEVFQVTPVSEIKERLSEFLKLADDPEAASGEASRGSFNPSELEKEVNYDELKKQFDKAEKAAAQAEA